MGLSILVLEAAGLGLAALLIHYVYNYFTTPLKDIPGPFWAKFSNIWRLVDHFNATQIVNQQRLHDQLGSAVRIGPNFVSLSDPDLIKTVYSTRGNFLKVSRPYILRCVKSIDKVRATSMPSTTPFKMAIPSRMCLALEIMLSMANTCALFKNSIR